MKQKTLAVLVSLLLVAMLLTGCAKKAADDVNEVPQEQPQTNQDGQAAVEQLPTEEAADVDTDLNQEAVDSEISDLEEDLEDW